MAAQNAESYAVSALKAISYRISSTPTTQLPRCVAQLAASIWVCRGILCRPIDTLKQDSELSVVVHRFKTQLSTLLADRTVEGRWAAIVLIRTTIEAGGVEILSKSNAWVRNLLGFLKKPDPPSTRCLAVLTLTRVFMLTWEYSNLVREITTPALPTFISTCLSNADNSRCSDEELQAILEAFEVLISHHPTIFRSNESALHDLLIRIISSSASTDIPYHSPQHILTAQRVLVLLAYCAPKQGGAEKWDESLQTVVKSAHQTCDIIFSPVVEVWKSNIDAYKDHAAARQSIIHLEQKHVEQAGFKAWTGAFAGAERLVTLLDQLRAHVLTASPATVPVRIGIVMDLTSRLFLVTVPGSKKSSLQPNTQMASNTRDVLFATLPIIHEHAFNLLEVMIRRLGAAMLPAMPVMLEAICAVFTTESFDVQLRSATYSLLGAILEQARPGLSKDEITDMNSIMTACCNDLLPDSRQKSQGSDKLAKPQTTDLVLQMSKKDTSSQVSLQSSSTQAAKLLPVLLSRLDPIKVSRKVRTLIDRTAILTQHKASLVASVLNPPPNPSGNGLQSSLLPLLARLFPEVSETEALIRPRMPVIATSHEMAQHEYHSDLESEDDVMDDVKDLREDDEASTAAVDDQATLTVRNDNLESSENASIQQANSGLLDSFLRSGKHALNDEDNSSTSKRARQDVDGGQVQIEWNTALASQRQVDERSQSAGPEPQVAGSMLMSDGPADGDSDDGSDFDMPPLTMEQDTEDESE